MSFFLLVLLLCQSSGSPQCRFVVSAVCRQRPSQRTVEFSLNNPKTVWNQSFLRAYLMKERPFGTWSGTDCGRTDAAVPIPGSPVMHVCTLRVKWVRNTVHEHSGALALTPGREGTAG